MESKTFLLVVVLTTLLVIFARKSNAIVGLPNAKVTSITRQNNGDIFTAEGIECNSDTCVGLSSGTASLAPGESGSKDQQCTCQCHKHLPAYREDLQICVDDIQECILAPFVSSSTSQQIPFVFLPLKGQIIHPSKEISFKGIQKPVCAVSSAKFLTEGGWIDLRNPIDTDVPFRLFRDEGRTFLQWVGDTELRNRMNGRLVLVNLLCREIDLLDLTPDTQVVFAPCVAFRVVGSPIKHLYNVSEVIFSPDNQSQETTSSSGLSISEYVAIGISSILLGLIYVASVFLYLHLRKRKKDRDKNMTRQNIQSLGNVEEGVVKNNPLMGLGRHFVVPDSDSGSSDTDVTPDIISQHHHEERINKNKQITSALIHPVIQSHGNHRFEFNFNYPMNHHHIENLHLHQESSNIERLPEEDVSIVETLEGRNEERPENLRAITPTTRKKLYFNPAYFEPHLLATPPPGALEFLSKIREVISIAKQKMASKKFTPTLTEIPEEPPQPQQILDQNQSQKASSSTSRRGSMISLKRENSRRKTCTGCPGCEPQDFKKLYGKLPVYPALGPCGNCASDNQKQHTIRKWLEDIPVWKPAPVSLDELNSSRNALNKSLQNLSGSMKLPKRLRSPTRSLPPEPISSPILNFPLPDFSNQMSPNSSSTTSSSSPTHSIVTQVNQERRIKKPKKPKVPPPPRPVTIQSQSPLTTTSTVKATALNDKNVENENRNNNIEILGVYNVEDLLLMNNGNEDDDDDNIKKTYMPDMIQEAIIVDEKSESKLEGIGQKQQQHQPINEITDKASFMRKLNSELQKKRRQHLNQQKQLLNKQGEEEETSSSPELEVRRVMDYETDSLERSCLKRGMNSPTDYGDMSSSQPSPSLSSALPMDEEMTMQNAIINRKTGAMTISKLNMNLLEDEAEQNEYELIVMKNNNANAQNTSLVKTLLGANNAKNLLNLPELLQRNDYSLVTEVYVNNGYNYESSPSSPADSNTSTLERPKLRYRQSSENPGCLLIEVQDCADNYIKVEESDGFEPDTFDRKMSKHYKNKNGQNQDDQNVPINEIFLRSSGSFKSSSGIQEIQDALNKNLSRNFGSLREIYEAKVRKSNLWGSSNSVIDNNNSNNEDEEGRLLTLEERHCKRQRKLGKEVGVQPDVIPPPPHDSTPIYEHPKPPRKVVMTMKINPPPVPPKNHLSRDANKTTNTNQINHQTAQQQQQQQEQHQKQNSSNIQNWPNKNSNFNSSTSTSSSSPVVEVEIGVPAIPIKSEQQQKARTTTTGFVINEDKKFSPFPPTTSSKRENNHFLSSKNWSELSRHLEIKSKEDSGYLSTDSNGKEEEELEREEDGSDKSETDTESLCDLQSESGAESVETHSVFFGSCRKMCLANSLDSGVDSDFNKSINHITNVIEDSVTNNSSDSETVSYATIVPLGSSNRSSPLILDQ